MRHKHTILQGFLGALAVLLAPIALHHDAAAQSAANPAPSPHADSWRTTILEENDSLYFNSDKHYTQGLRLSFLSPVLTPGGWTDDIFNFFGKMPTVFA